MVDTLVGRQRRQLVVVHKSIEDVRGPPIMKRVALIVASIALTLSYPAMTLLAANGAGPSGSHHKWKFSPTINAPWALEDDQQPLDSPILAAGLCRASPFNTTGAYGKLVSNVTRSS